MTLYLDDSGTRRPDRHPKDPVPEHGYDWFGLGGVIVRDSDRAVVEAAHEAFYRRWELTAPLHSTEIRYKSRGFRCLRTFDGEKLARFYMELSRLVTLPQLTAIACVVDRPGYNARYETSYGRKRWSLCKTAFSIVVERAAKFARRNGCRLRVYVEQSGRKIDERMEGYYDELRSHGQPFDSNRSAGYEPLTKADFEELLYEFRTKAKSSELMQLADVALYPLCRGGYEPTYRAYVEMCNFKMRVDDKLPDKDRSTEGIKYSCWELQKGQSPGVIPGFGAASIGET